VLEPRLLPYRLSLKGESSNASNELKEVKQATLKLPLPPQWVLLVMARRKRRAINLSAALFAHSPACSCTVRKRGVVINYFKPVNK